MTIRAVTESSRPASRNTRAVIPMLVAARAAPRNSDVRADSSRRTPTTPPRTTGAATPIKATFIDVRPTLRIAAVSTCIPTRKRRTAAAASATCRRPADGVTAFMTDGPMMTPAPISSTSLGTYARATRAIRVINRWRTWGETARRGRRPGRHPFASTSNPVDAPSLSNPPRAPSAG